MSSVPTRGSPEMVGAAVSTGTGTTEHCEGRLVARRCATGQEVAS